MTKERLHPRSRYPPDRRRGGAATPGAIIDEIAAMAAAAGVEEVVLPCIEPAATYAAKAGPEVLGQMYAFPDRGGCELCLRPEGAATLQALARGFGQSRRDVRVCFEIRCWATSGRSSASTARSLGRPEQALSRDGTAGLVACPRPLDHAPRCHEYYREYQAGLVRCLYVVPDRAQRP
jgi:hypothetical protein